MENFQISFKKWNWGVKSRLFGFGTGPEVDWKIIFISTMVLTILIIVLSTFIFIKINKGEIFVVEKSAERGEKVLDVSLLKKTVFYYQDKALEFERIKSLVTPAVDPSL